MIHTADAPLRGDIRAAERHDERVTCENSSGVLNEREGEMRGIMARQKGKEMTERDNRK